MTLYEDFDPNGTGNDNGNYFGLPFAPEDSALVLLSVPWDVTASYGGGSSSGPDAIIGASTQLDLYDAHAPQMWRKGIGTIGIDYTIQERSSRLREDAVRVIKHLENGGKTTDDSVKRKIERVNTVSAEINQYVYNESQQWLATGKIVGLVGGDHSTPYGLIKAVAEKEEEIGILHIDAHRDLRECYEGFTHSHASIMYNVATAIDGVKSIVQVGVRDWCDCEQEFADSCSKIVSFEDHKISETLFGGGSWADICTDIARALPRKVYVSFDIDGLSPENCPHTGTPVPGGLSFNQAVFLLNRLVETGRKIVGFDLCEVSPATTGEWDGNVGARALYKLCNLSLKSNQ